MEEEEKAPSTPKQSLKREAPYDSATLDSARELGGLTTLTSRNRALARFTSSGSSPLSSQGIVGTIS